MQALEDLDYLAALDDDGNLSEVGIIMSEFPLDPPLAKALVAACEFDCVDEMLTLAAMLTGGAGPGWGGLPCRHRADPPLPPQLGPASCRCPHAWRRPWLHGAGYCCTAMATTSPSSMSSTPTSSVSLAPTRPPSAPHLPPPLSGPRSFLLPRGCGRPTAPFPPGPAAISCSLWGSMGTGQHRLGQVPGELVEPRPPAQVWGRRGSQHPWGGVGSAPHADTGLHRRGG